ncbi:elongation factor G [Methylocapsa palsarum]|uniref:Elongation factor G n=1 Tax=Methylocapsa palsarum TaxID=1612308 RepID=A0A1I3Y6A9_9HYPH|nr:elongation factor G [Methylocapsa palsarum]SFK27355.1 elongation factor G [Methylocapsa palsarum]
MAPESSTRAASPGPRAVALVGPYGSGKSTLFNALLEAAGTPQRKPRETRGRTMSTELRLGHCSFLGDPWSLVDCPGSVEFSYETECALRAADLAVVVCEPAPDRFFSLPVLLKTLEDLGLPHLIFVNKIDTFAGSFREMIAALQTHSKRPLLPRQIPIGSDEAVTGYVDVVRERAYKYGASDSVELIDLPPDMREPEKEALAGLTETLADQDDDLMEKLLEDIAPTQGEIFEHLRKDQASGSIVEVLLGAASRGYGVTRLWKALRHDAPAAQETARRYGVAAGDQPLVQIFKTAQAGKISYARVWRGEIHDGAALDGHRIGAIQRFVAGEAVRMAEARAGDLVALGRLDKVATGAVMGVGGGNEALQFPSPPPPVYALAIKTKDRQDDVKLSAALHKLVEEDPSLKVEHDAETGDTLLMGQGEIHLNSVLERLFASSGIEVETKPPGIAYKETIGKPVVQHARLKRQTGGHGQFADVKLEIEPRARGGGFLFADKIVGGTVPKQYIPAVREAAEDAMLKGPSGYPVVDVGVALVDGSFHAVDSSDMAFKTATKMAIQEGLAKADPILLEPIDHVTVSVPNAYTAAAQRLLSGRRGHILGYGEKPGWPGWDDIEALTPAAELHDFIIELRSDTMGLGDFRRRFDHLAEARGKSARGH